MYSRWSDLSCIQPQRNNIFRCWMSAMSSFLLDRTKPFCSSPRLFVTYANRMKCQVVSSQMISRWITSCMVAACNVAQATPSEKVQGHSMSTQAMLTAFISDIPILDVLLQISRPLLLFPDQMQTVRQTCSQTRAAHSAAVTSPSSRACSDSSPRILEIPLPWKNPEFVFL